MDPYFVLSLIPLVGVNIWHGLLIASPDGTDRPRSISEHAAATPRRLLIHRLAHIAASIMLAAFALLYLLPNGYTLEAILLVMGALFDVIEVMTLNKTSASRWTMAEPHFAAAWLMVVSYLLYGVAISHVAGLDVWFPHAVWLFFVLLMIVTARDRFKYLWAAQMCYFVLLATVVIAAHAVLL